MMEFDEGLQRTLAKKVREVYDLRVYVVGGGFQYIKMFHELGFLGARNVEDADVVCFTGGEDVDPSLYGERPLACTHFNRQRDDIELAIYGECLAFKRPMVGICRGAQFLNVCNGGKLWQDVNNHGRSHSVVYVPTGEIYYNITSTHHQMMIPASDGIVLCTASEATQKHSESEIWESAAPVENFDIEAVWYPDTLSLCFQPHPEFIQGECRNLFTHLLDEYILPAC